MEHATEGITFLKYSGQEFYDPVTPKDLDAYPQIFDKRFGIFGELSAREASLAVICRNAAIIAANKGAYIQRQGQAADTTPFHVLVDGHLSVRHHYIKRGGRVVNVGMEDGAFGAIVGEVELLINNMPGLEIFPELGSAIEDRSVSSATAWADVVCETDCTLLRIFPARVLLDIQDYGLAVRVARLASLRVLRRNSFAEQFILAHGQARDYVAKVLLDLLPNASPMENGKYRLAIRPAHLAALANVKPQNVYSLFGATRASEPKGYFGRKGATFAGHDDDAYLVMDEAFIAWLKDKHGAETSAL